MNDEKALDQYKSGLFTLEDVDGEQVLVRDKQRLLYIDGRQEEEEYGEPIDDNWFEIVRAFTNKSIITCRLSGLEENNEGDIAIAYYFGYRIIIPIHEMNVIFKKGQNEHGTEKNRILKIINNMIGAKIDLVIMAIHDQDRVVMASRRIAMEWKRKHFYFPNDEGVTYITPGRKVQARVVSVAEKAMKLEVFGVDCVIHAKDIDWGWIGNVRNKYSIGDIVNVVITEIDANEETKEVSIKVNMKVLQKNEILKKIATIEKNGHYYAEVTDIRNEYFYMEMENGLNVVAKKYQGRKRPGKHDGVMFVVVGLNREKGVVFGEITKIIEQNI